MSKYKVDTQSEGSIIVDLENENKRLQARIEELEADYKDATHTIGDSTAKLANALSERDRLQGALKRIIKKLGMELPSPGTVDAINIANKSLVGISEPDRVIRKKEDRKTSISREEITKAVSLDEGSK